MEETLIALEAERNFAALRANAYPGRGIVSGLADSGEYLVQVYWIMGRSANSRNRVFLTEGARLYTELADPSQGGDLKNIIYNAMRESHWRYVVSNGDQTDTVIESASAHLDKALAGRTYEDDKPNYTQRISAMCVLGGMRPYIDMSILRKSRFGDRCDRASYSYDCLAPGIGFYISTYAGDGNPLPPFRGEPLLMPLSGSMAHTARTYWDALNEANRVSLAVKFISLESGVSSMHIINKHDRVE